MPFDNQLFHAPATRGDVAGLAIDLAMSLSVIKTALRALKSGEDPKASIDEIAEMIKQLHGTFDDLTGWKEES